MTKDAFIKLVSNADQQQITLQDLKDLFYCYKDLMKKTGKQLGWNYDDAAFPYEVREVNENKESMFYLKGIHPQYYALILKLGSETIYREESEQTHEQQYIQISLPTGATHGDKGKANEFCKFIAKKLMAELHLFNGRVMYFHKRG